MLPRLRGDDGRDDLVQGVPLVGADEALTLPGPRNGTDRVHPVDVNRCSGPSPASVWFYTWECHAARGPGARSATPEEIEVMTQKILWFLAISLVLSVMVSSRVGADEQVPGGGEGVCP